MALTNGSKIVTIAGLRKVYDQLLGKISGVYKPCGSIAFADLPAPSANTLGNLYNIEDDFITTDDFVEGKDKEYSAGNNIGIILVKNTDPQTGTVTEEYKYDVFGTSLNIDSTKFVTQAQFTKATAEMSNYVRDIDFQPNNTNTVVVTKGNGSSTTYTLNVGKNADVIKDITIDTSLSTDLGHVKHRRITRSDNNSKVHLLWEDPDDSPNDAWGETVVVKKKGSYPTDIEDGTLVLICAVKNKFKATAYVDDQQNSEDWFYRAFPIATSGAVSNSNLNRFDYWHYAVCIDESNPIEADSVTYPAGYDNENYKPLRVIMNTNAQMANNKCDWGDWKNAPFMPRPCMLTYDGKVDYYLDPDDYTLKEDGSPSDVTDSNYAGNAMMEFSPVFIKPERVGDNLYIYFCSEKYDDNYECWSCKKEDGTYADHYYMAIYEASYINGKFRSLSTGKVADTSLGGIQACMNYAAQCGQGWNIDLWSDWDLLRCLGILVTKRLNSQKAIGAGATSYHCVPTGAGNQKGMFWGALDYQNTYATKFFGIENPWSHNWRYCAGIIMDSDALTIKIKHTYSVVDGSTINGYNDTGTGYINTGLKIPTSGYISKIQGDSQCITAPMEIKGGSDTTYYSDYIWYSSTGLFINGYGGDSSFGLFSWGSSSSPSSSYASCGAALSFKNF